MLWSAFRQPPLALSSTPVSVSACIPVNCSQALRGRDPESQAPVECGFVTLCLVFEWFESRGPLWEGNLHRKVLVLVLFAPFVEHVRVRDLAEW